MKKTEGSWPGGGLQGCYRELQIIETQILDQWILGGGGGTHTAEKWDINLANQQIKATDRLRPRHASLFKYCPSFLCLHIIGTHNDLSVRL